MAASHPLTAHRPGTGEWPGPDSSGAPLRGFHWEFSEAENKRFGDAIRTAIDCDEHDDERDSDRRASRRG